MLIGVAVSIFITTVTAADVNAGSKILGKILASNYSKTSIPVNCNANSSINSQCPFVIQTRLFLIRVQQIVESEETLYSTVRLQLVSIFILVPEPFLILKIFKIYSRDGMIQD